MNLTYLIKVSFFAWNLQWCLLFATSSLLIDIVQCIGCKNYLYKKEKYIYFLFTIHWMLCLSYWSWKRSPAVHLLIISIVLKDLWCELWPLKCTKLVCMHNGKSACLHYLKTKSKFITAECQNLAQSMIADFSLTPSPQDQYDPAFQRSVQTSQVVTIGDVKAGRLNKGISYRLVYHTKDNFKKITKSLGLMDDFRVRPPEIHCNK